MLFYTIQKANIRFSVMYLFLITYFSRTRIEAIRFLMIGNKNLIERATFDNAEF
jgi:hypothetical protein